MFGLSAMAFDVSSYSSIIILALVVVVFYFLLIRPQKKQEQQQNQMRAGLQVGDEITTIGGIIGKITSIKGETVTIETSKDKTKIRFLKSAVRSVDVKAEESAVPVKTAVEETKEVVLNGEEVKPEDNND